MSVQAVSWAMYGQHGDRLDPVSRFVLVVLADHANADGIAWPSRDRIARTIGASVDTVDRRLNLLANAGAVERLHADDRRLPAAWHDIPADRRPVAYRLAYTGPQVAAPSPPRGRSSAVTGPQQRGDGAAAVRHEPRTEPRTEPARATATAPPPPPRTQGPHPCTICRHMHPPTEDHVRKQPPAIARQGAALARQALTESTRP